MFIIAHFCTLCFVWLRFLSSLKVPELCLPSYLSKHWKAVISLSWESVDYSETYIQSDPSDHFLSFALLSHTSCFPLPIFLNGCFVWFWDTGRFLRSEHTSLYTLSLSKSGFVFMTLRLCESSKLSTLNSLYASELFFFSSVLSLFSFPSYPYFPFIIQSYGLKL